MHTKDFYRGYYLNASSTPEPGSGFMARVAIVSLGGGKTQSQRFLDLAVFGCEQQALCHALHAGKDWIDAQLVRETASRSSGAPGVR